MKMHTYHASVFLITGCLLWMNDLSAAYGDPASMIRLGRMAMTHDHPYAP